jgi:chromate transporter
MMASASDIRAHWREIMGLFLKLGAMSYGGPAIMGMMQAEIQGKRGWLSKENFVEGLALVNMLPGAGATQLGIFLGFTRAGWWGGLLAGLCFVLPAFAIMLALTWVYSRYGALPLMRGVFYGLAPVVVGIFAVAVQRLGRAAIKDAQQLGLALATALILYFTTLGIIPVLLMAGALGVVLYGAKLWGIVAALTLALMIGVLQWMGGVSSAPGVSVAPAAAGVWEIGAFFFKVGAFSFGGGLSMLAFMQDQVVNQLHWLTQQQFVDGLALSQLTPGPILMVAAFVGYQKASFGGALAGAVAIFLPSFLLMLSILPMFERIKRIVWMRFALKGISPAVIGMISVALVQMLPKAVPNWITVALAIATIVLMIARRCGPLPLMVAGGAIGLLLHI